VKVLASILFTAAGLVSVTMLTDQIVLSFIGSSSLGLGAKSVLASLLLFAPASVCLGMVTPFAVRLRSQTVPGIARNVGSLYALSTVGSIVGTFAAGFVLLPFVGSTRTLYLLAGLLFATSLLAASSSLSVFRIAVL